MYVSYISNYSHTINARVWFPSMQMRILSTFDFSVKLLLRLNHTECQILKFEPIARKVCLTQLLCTLENSLKKQKRSRLVGENANLRGWDTERKLNAIKWSFLLEKVINALPLLPLNWKVVNSLTGVEQLVSTVRSFRFRGIWAIAADSSRKISYKAWFNFLRLKCRTNKNISIWPI